MAGILSVNTNTTSDGTQIISLLLDFTGVTSLTVNLGGPTQSRLIPIRTIFVDLSTTDSSLTFASQVAGDTPTLTASGRSTGYYPCDFSSPINLDLTYTGAAQYNPVRIQFLSNVVPGPVWPSIPGIADAVWNHLPTRSLTVDPATDAGAAALVWNHAGRTLTADPATDAGAASLVWGHSTRTLTADPATDAGAASLVWAHTPTRSLTVDPATDAGAGTIIWGHSARTLTADPFTDAGGATLVWGHSTRTLTADPFTDAGGATLVWGHSTRTLTADPATDAGAATLVWTHSTRTLTADPATDAGAATLVWTHSTRTLTADPATDAGAATLVWGHSTRTLTSLSPALSAQGVSQQTLAANSTVTFQQAAGQLAILDIATNGGGLGNQIFQFFDGGTDTIDVQTIPGSAGFHRNGIQRLTMSGHTAYWQLKSTNTTSTLYFYSGMLLT